MLAKINMINKSIQHLQKTIDKIKIQSESVINAYTQSDTYVIKNSKGSVNNYKYFVYPYKNFSETNPQDEQFIAHHLSSMISQDIDYLVTFEADGIGIGKLVSVKIDKPLIVCKPFHYNQKVFSFIQKTGYFERIMYCPSLIQGKKIAIIDCMVSTGGTIKGFLESLTQHEQLTNVEGIYAVVNKSNYQKKGIDIFKDKKYNYLFDVMINENEEIDARISEMFRETFWKEINMKIMNMSKKLAKKSDLSRNNFEVGAMVMDNQNFKILGWGNKTKTSHAEFNAIKMAKKYDLKGLDLTLYSTLEPCVKRKLKNMPSCCSLIGKMDEIQWVVIGKRDMYDEENFNRGIEYLIQHKKHIVCFDYSLSIPINYHKELSKRKYFSDKIIIDWDKIVSSYQKTIDNEYILEPLLIKIIQKDSISGRSILDLGCGRGKIAFELSKKAKQSIGVDLSQNFIQEAQRLYKNKNLRYLVSDGRNMKSIKNKSIDIVVSNLVFLIIPSLSNLDEIFSEIERILKPGGKVIFSTSHSYFEHKNIKNIKTVESVNYNYFKVDDVYKITLRNKLGKPTVSFKYYHRKLADIIHLLVKNKFMINQFIEPKPSAQLLKKFPFLKAELEFPPFMVISAIKK